MFFCCCCFLCLKLHKTERVGPFCKEFPGDAEVTPGEKKKSVTVLSF